ncbi:hemerythrin domain-containing protein [Permianibacter sp. IMCC34836]|uniref:hemerythrin domain-containing protein n=1 Tax=Permianibacter fluminis TaxID=2738515 RepID=UPI00155216AB|nr:hemerythrin domain-containing protein [Permianibacter fluminis]NQD38481.1 hemerythrin domain-containing protein [Permianibacter fluminis]
MRRHPALHRLSREHSPALTLARRLLQADAPASIAVAQDALRRWHRDLLQHFADEESVLLPLLVQLQESADGLRLQQDHVALRQALANCADAATTDPATGVSCRALGEQLRAHVHFEERQLFPLLEQRLTAGQWQAVAAALATTGAT